MNNRDGYIAALITLITLFSGTLHAAEDIPKKAFDCVIQPKAKIKLGSAEEGILKELLVQRGDLVKEGDLLVKLDAGMEELSAELARLRAETDVDVRLAGTQLEFRRRETERLVSLSKKKAISEMDLDKARVEERLSRLAYESAKTEREIIQVEYERAKQRLERRFIRSPVDAVVVDVDMAAGEYAHEQAELMTLAVINPLHVEVFVPVSYYGQVKAGSVAVVQPESPVGGSYQAEVKVVDQVLDPASRTFGVRLVVANPDYQLPAGLRCKVSFEQRAEAELRYQPQLRLDLETSSNRTLQSDEAVN